MDQSALAATKYNTVSWDNLDASGAINVTLGNVEAAKASAKGTQVGIGSAVVTGAYSGFFYVEDTGRVSGIRINSSTTVTVGQTVQVIGTTDTVTGTSEKCIDATSVTVATGAGSVAPLGLTNKAADMALSNGLLITAWGKITTTSAGDYLYVDDGSGLSDGSGNTGIRVDLSELTSSPSSGPVVVTGVLGYELAGSNAVLVIRPRTNADISK